MIRTRAEEKLACGYSPGFRHPGSTTGGSFVDPDYSGVAAKTKPLPVKFSSTVNVCWPADVGGRRSGCPCLPQRLISRRGTIILLFIILKIYSYI